MKEEIATITINAEPPKPTTFEDLGYVQVIHCKDCKRYIPHGRSGTCDAWGDWCDLDEWCSRAEKK